MRNFKTLAAGIALAVATLASATPASAALIVRDYQAAGDGLLTYDTVSGLEWLDFSVSLGKRPGSVLASYSGFHFANLQEVQTLLVGAGIALDHVTTSQAVYYAQDLAAANELSHTIGVTESYLGGALQNIRGRVLRADGQHYDIMTLQIRNAPASPVGAATQFLAFGNSITGWGSNEADFLVRIGAPPVSAVPQPSTWMMLIGGFAIMGAGLRRRRTRLETVRA